MNKNRLPREQELTLLGKLSSDDAFRTRYETDPRAALKEMGVTDSILASLDPAGLAPGKLADKAVIAQTLKQLTEQRKFLFPRQAILVHVWFPLVWFV